jgi:hypothetical protein
VHERKIRCAWNFHKRYPSARSVNAKALGWPLNATLLTPSILASWSLGTLSGPGPDRTESPQVPHSLFGIRCSPSGLDGQVRNEKRGNLIDELFRRSALEIRQDHN